MTRHTLTPQTTDDGKPTQYPYMAPSASISEELNAAYTLQNMQHAGKAMPHAQPPRNESEADVDFLTCGNCQKEFLLSSIVEFMRHKKLDCSDPSYNGTATDLYQRLMCQIKNCQQRFATAWALLQHVQNSHALNIFLNYSNTIQPLNSHRGETVNSQPVNSHRTETVNGIQSVNVQREQSSNLDMNMTTLLSLGDTFQDIQMREERQSVETQTEKSEDQEEECEDPCEDFCSPEVCAMRNCCDTQNCCITIMPGTHERPKKCCASVVPKKRKQHMEQHISSGGPATRARTRRKSAGVEPARPDTIFIDFGTPMDNSSNNSQQIENFGPNFPGGNNNSGFIQVEGTNMYVRNADNSMTFSVDQQSQPGFDESQDLTLQEPFQSLFMEGLPLDLPDSSPPKDDKKKRYPTSKPFKCDHCGMAFNQRIHLKKHLSKHTGIKPFKCGQCNYSTVERSHLKVHIRIHTGEKPFKCGFCEYATAQNSTLKIHLKRHHQGMVLSCTVCGKNFEQPKLLNQHKQEHETESAGETT